MIHSFALIATKKGHSVSGLPVKETVSPHQMLVMWSSTSWSQRAFGCSASSARIQGPFFSVGLIPVCRNQSIIRISQCHTSDASLLITVVKDWMQAVFIIALTAPKASYYKLLRVITEKLHKHKCEKNKTYSFPEACKALPMPTVHTVLL